MGEATLACSGCQHKFLVPISTTAYRCYKCLCVSHSISGSEKSRKESRAKVFKHDELNSANKNGALQKSLSPSPASSSSFSTPRYKRAVICGVTYGKRKFKLKGTINDVKNIKSLLLDKFKFPNECIRVLTEDQRDPNLIPTRRNLLNSLHWLVENCDSQSEGSLVFYFSGHGSQQPEHKKGDEVDGLDETICPVDFVGDGVITDNDLNSIIIRPLKKGFKLHAIIDACHSGTTLDLRCVYKKEKGSWKWEDNKASKTKQTNGGLAICFSACDDSQMAGDSAAFDGKNENGIMTYLFSKIVREDSEITYARLLENIHEEIGMIHQSKFYNGCLRRIFYRKIDQVGFHVPSSLVAIAFMFQVSSIQDVV
uniref:Metacaspase-3 n=1 Tax=Cajanus cajan TaxID=3821 RepID=A0A151T0I9_CAJCA|nr:Metacaspase-3 [Cajanus cajan]